MVIIAIDDLLDVQLELVSTSKGRTKSDIVMEALREYVKKEKRNRLLLDPALITLYVHLADEDVALAESGIVDYYRQLEYADKV